MGMNIERRVYSPDDWEAEFDSDALPRDPALLDLHEICLPLGDCVKAFLGPVTSAVVDRLESRGLDQAPVEVPDAVIGWRLVSLSTLRSLQAEERKLTSDHQNFLPDDVVRLGGRFIEPGFLRGSVKDPSSVA